MWHLEKSSQHALSTILLPHKILAQCLLNWLSRCPFFVLGNVAVAVALNWIDSKN